DLAQLQLVAVAQGRDALDPDAVDERAIGAAAALDVPRPATERQEGELDTRGLGVDDDRVVHVAAEGRDRVEADARALRRLAPRRGKKGEAGAGPDTAPSERQGGA